ncbi:hypothetical protein CDAR_116431 [Caerostris darwini]|uniref:Uncharacterized protein n=1 Tax=Caerostris darwini TaxID=1538125 RepID=A0AAV4PII6_9ARAC|nr:hypothetical protein CDAR_116431 [Caerostris darwini]
MSVELFSNSQLTTNLYLFRHKQQPKVEQQHENDKTSQSSANLLQPEGTNVNLLQREGKRRSLPPITVTVSDDGAPNPPETPPRIKQRPGASEPKMTGAQKGGCK